MFKKVHAVTVSLGGEASSNQYNSSRQTNRGYYPDRGKTFYQPDAILLGQPEYYQYRIWLSSHPMILSDTKTNMLSAYLSATYTFDQRYTLNFNTRMDGSNQFGSRSNEKLLPIWSASGRWNMKKDILKDVKFVDDMSLKLSYGKQGNMLDNQTSRAIIQKGKYDNNWGDFTSNLKYYANPDLKWETTSSYNAELTFSLLKGKIGGTVGYFYKHTKDAFLSKRVSSINGVQNYTVNRGEVSNQGLELTLNFTPINQKVDANGRRGFVWRFDPQIGQVVNKLISKAINNKTHILQDKITYSSYLNGSVELPGKPLNTFYSYRFKGLSSVDGHPIFFGTEEELADQLHERYKNMDREEVWKEIMEESGTRVPTLQGGISNYFGYRQFGLSFNFTYSLGNKVRLLKMGGSNNIKPYPDRNMRREFVYRWQQPGDEKYTNIPALVANDQLNIPWWARGDKRGQEVQALYQFAGNSIYDMYDYSDIRVASGNYLKLQSLSLRYNVHDKICKRMHLRSAYFSLTGTNLFTICSKKLKGQDVVTQSGSSPSINLGILPSYSFQLNVSF